MARLKIRGAFVCHDVRYVDTVELDVELERAPTREEAERLLYPLAEGMVQRREHELYPLDFTSVTVEALNDGA